MHGSVLLAGICVRLQTFLRYFTACGGLWLLLVPAVNAGQFSVQVVDREGDAVVGAGLYLRANNNAGRPLSSNNTVIEVLQLSRRFAPAVSVVPVGAQLRFINNDDITHHIYTISGEDQFSLLIRRDESSELLRFSMPGVLALGCNIHDWMGGYLVIADAKYWGNTDNSGQWQAEIENGSYELVVWHPKLKNEWRQTIAITGNNSMQAVVPTGYDATKGQKSVNDFDFLEEY